MVGHYNDFKIYAEKGSEIVLPEKTLPRSPGHHREWINAIKSRQECSCRFAYGHRVTASSRLLEDPVARPGAAFDGDPSTAWLASPRDQAPRLRITFDTPVRPTSLGLLTRSGSLGAVRAVIVAEPSPTPVTSPDALTVATCSLEVVQVTALFVAFEGSTAAVNVCV